MARTVKVISKNTFITFVTEANDGEDASLEQSSLSSPRLQPRSRSADAVLRKSEDEDLSVLTSVLSTGVLQPSPPASRAPSRASSPAMSPAMSPNLKPKGLFRPSSNMSVSTMAPDDASEPSGMPGMKSAHSSCSISSMVSSSSNGMSRMKPVWSSGSISSMVSWADITEDEEMEFECDIEAGAEAAMQQAPLERPTPSLSKPKGLFRTSSNKSVSNMAPHDASESSGISGMKSVHSSGSISSMVSCSSHGMSGMKPVTSSCSISSMVSWADITEDEEMEFELDIEGGAKAATQVALGRPTPNQSEVSPIAGSEAVKITPGTSPVMTAERRPVIATETRPVITTETRPVSTPEASSQPGKVTREMIHNLVPKTQNLVDMYNSTKDEPTTTLMIRNIPGKYSQNDLMMDLRDAGYENTYDFLYLPIDKGTSNNVGYSFVNFVHPSVAANCMENFQGHRFARLQRSSNKLARVSVAHMQGLEKNLAHYEKAAVNGSKEKRRRPVILANLSSMIV